MTKARRRPAPLPIPKVEGPTKEAMAHGEYILPETRGARAVYTNRRVNTLARLHANGSISQREYAGGLCFVETYTAVWGSPSPNRDSCVLRVGGIQHETDREAERMAQKRARLNTILNRVGPSPYSMLVSICVFGDQMGNNEGRNAKRYLVLKASLEECATVYGVSE